jgi:site-specific DNA recombinase
MTETLSGLKVAFYARVSGEEQKQGHNIDSQLAELKEFAKQRDWSVVDAYLDEAWSGAALARPALDKLRDDAGRKLFDIVLINDVDRLARDVSHLGIIKRDLERSGVKVVFRKIPSENSPTHNLLVNILGSFAEFERELILDRTRRGRRHKVETRQEFIGCIAPYGYRYIRMEKPERLGKLVIKPEEAAVVRKIFEWVDCQGLSILAVVDRLNKEGIRPRKGGKGWEG